jgi:GT2 family glycosyltransferase
MTQSPLVIIIILNTNRRDDTLAALASLAASDYPHQRTIVLDNASIDGSVEAIHLSYPKVEVIELEQNLGYAGNNNVGIQAALSRGAEWVFILNEDTVVAPICLTRLVEVGESDSRIGIVGPMVYHHDEPDVIQSAGGRMDRQWRAWHLAQNEVDQGQFSLPHSVEWISGCAIMVRRSVIEQVGGLDERFFYYWEETEWCLRARGHGWMILHVPKAKLWHKGVQRNYRPEPNVTYYNTRNRFLMLSKHKAPLRAWLVLWGQTLRTLASWSIKKKWRSMRKHKIAMWQGTLDFLNHHWGVRSF